MIAPTYVHAREWVRKEGVPPERVVYRSTVEQLLGYAPDVPTAPRVVRVVVPGYMLAIEVVEWLERWRAVGGAVEYVTL